MRYLHEHSLRRRLRSLLNDLDGRFQTDFIRNAGDFIDKVVNTRNALSHGFALSADAPGWYGPDRVSDMPYAAWKLRFIAVALILQDLGMPRERVWSLLARNFRFRFLRDERGDL